MGNSSSSTSRDAAITLAAVAATATAAWAFASYLSSETVVSQGRSSATLELQVGSSGTKESQHKSSKTKESRSRSSETVQDLNYVDVHIGANPIYGPETKGSLSGNEVRVDQHIIQGPEIHQITHSQLDHIKASKVKDVFRNFKSKESCKQKEEVGDQNSRRSKAKQKLKADANKQIPEALTPNSRHLIENSERRNKTHCDKSNEAKEVCSLYSYTMCSALHLASLVTGVQAETSQVGSKKLTLRRQKNKQSDNQNLQKLKLKKKLKADGNNRIPRHLIPNIHLQETIKIMSYNIWSIKVKRDERMNAVNNLIEQSSPDIILLQEVTPEIYVYFQSCNWWGIYTCSVKGKQASKRWFCMMLSKLPVEKFFYKHFVNTKTCKGVSVAKFTSTSNKMLAVATCHLKSPDGPSTYDIERASQAKEAIDLLNFSPNVVLGGDMNWDEYTDGPFPLTGRWRDAWSDLKPEECGYTYDTESNAMLGNRRCAVRKRLDRFVCRLKDFDMIDIEIVGTEPIKGVSYKSNGKKLPLLPSDHYGLILTICAK